MGLMALIIIAGGASFSVAYLIQYIPLYAELFGVEFSPRLNFCKILAPMDATMTIILVCGPWIGITTAVFGISAIIYNVLSGIGISMGVLIVKKWFVPRWTEQFELMIEANKENLR